MCGIVGYVGKRQAKDIVIKGLRRLEYRGYDSSGIAYINGTVQVHKKAGKLVELENLLSSKTIDTHLAIGHTRWATHGEPNDTNAHPHLSQDNSIAIIHNGIIENYDSLKKELLKKGHSFKSETDTEVLVHFIEQVQKENECNLEEAVRLALNEVVGAYAILVISKTDPTQIIAARKGSPLLIGVGKEEYFFASDATPFIEYTNNVIYLNDLEIANVSGNKLNIKTVNEVVKTVQIQKLELELEAIEKGGYPHFMLKEIMEQTKTLSDAMRGRLVRNAEALVLNGVSQYLNRFLQCNKITMLGCGTSWHASLVGEYLFEELARISTEVEYASEFRYRNPVLQEKDIVIAVSQSGETADTLAAVELAKSRGSFVYGVCNVVGSSIARATHSGTYLHAGPEIGVASTKAFTSQVMVLAMIALFIAKQKGTISESKYINYLIELSTIPEKANGILAKAKDIEKISEVFYQSKNMLYLGRGVNFPVALEGALKLKEISYIHAEGYPAAEMKHGPIALIDENMPVFVVVTKDSTYEKIISNIQEVKARKGRVIAIATEGDQQIYDLAEHVIEIPGTLEPFSPLLTVIPLQLFSYYAAVKKGFDPDKPRNLAKSVTVE